MVEGDCQRLPSISEWWKLPVGTAGKFYGDVAWNSKGTPPGVVAVTKVPPECSAFKIVRPNPLLPRVMVTRKTPLSTPGDSGQNSGQRTTTKDAQAQSLIPTR